MGESILRTPFPPPPKHPRAMSVEEAADANPRPHVPPPLDHEVQPPTGLGLNADETAFLFNRFLLKRHREDGQIIQFILAYCECRNASQAAREAGFPSSKGNGIRLRSDIHACIQAITDKAVLKYGYDAAELVERVKEVATLDPIEFENPDGSYKTHLSQIRPEARRAIKSFTVKNLYGDDPNGMTKVIGQLVKVELYDKLKSFELLGREKNTFKETKKIEHDVTGKMADVLLGGVARAEARALAAPEPPRDVIEITGVTGKQDE